MERIDVTDLTKTGEEPRGFSEKYWINDGIDKLVKYNSSVCVDSDVMESLSTTIFNALHIDVVNVALGYNSTCVDEQHCCIVDSFLTDKADISINLLNYKWPKVNTNDQQKNISSCFYKMFSIFGNLMGMNSESLELMKSQYIRMILGDCIIDNEDRRLKNLEAIYNEKAFSYRLAPAFDNALAFNAFNIGGAEGYCFIGNQEFLAEDIITYILGHYYPIVEDITQNLDYLAEHQMGDILNEYGDVIPLEKSLFIYKYIEGTNEFIKASTPDLAIKR